MLENLTRSFTNIFAGIRGRKITEKNVADTVREIQRALLDADVAFDPGERGLLADGEDARVGR